MRNLLASAALLLVYLTADAQAKVPRAEEVLKSAYAQAAKQNKKVLLMFHASWCGWCHKMDSSLADKSVKPLIDKNFVITHLTVYENGDKAVLDNPGALAFLTKNGGAETGIPYWFVLDKDGKVLEDSRDEAKNNVGCPASEKEVAYFVNVLKQTTALKEDELAIIAKRFRLNER